MPETAGNGSLMRLSPVAIRHWNNASACSDVSARQSRTTHGADEAVDACVAFADLLSRAIAGADHAALFRADYVGFRGSISNISPANFARLPRDDIKSSGYVIDSLGAALWAVGGANDFKRAVLRAANLGGDADTIAAIAGQLAGAIWGYSNIPDPWISRLAWHEEIVAVADRLLDAAAPQ